MKSSSHIYICTYIYIRRALFQNTLNTNPKIDVALQMPSSEIMILKRALHKYVHIYICEKLFAKTHSLNLTLALQAHCFGMALNAFWKELFIYIYDV